MDSSRCNWLMLLILAFLFSEPNVRAEIVVYIPQIAEYCTMEKELEGLAEGLLSSIVPSVVTGLQDSDNQVGILPSFPLCVDTHLLDL